MRMRSDPDHRLQVGPAESAQAGGGRIPGCQRSGGPAFGLLRASCEADSGRFGPGSAGLTSSGLLRR